MTKFSLESETAKVSLGYFPTLYYITFCHASNTVITGFGEFPILSWKANLYTNADFFSLLFS